MNIKMASRLRNIIVFWGFGASGMAGLIYEIVWSRALTNTIGGTVYSLSILLASFMAGLAIGGHYGGIYVSTRKEPIRVFAALQLGIGLFGIFTFFTINNLGPIYASLYYNLGSSFSVFKTVQMALVFLLMLVPTSLMGASFPVVVKAWAQVEKKAVLTAGDVYSVNTWGAVGGSLAAGFILVPLIGLQGANLFAVSINMVLACWSFVFVGRARSAIGTAAFFLAILVFSTISGPNAGLAFGYGFADHYGSYSQFLERIANFETLFDQESVYGRVQGFLGPPGADGERERLLANGGRLEGSSHSDATTQKLLALLPLAAHDNPSSVMNIGLGTGMTLATLISDPRVKKIENVEINPTIYRAVEEHFYPGLFNSQRATAVIDDARHHLQLCDPGHDVIISEPSYPTSKAVSHLFTKDYYEIVRDKLAEDGVFAQWLPRYLLQDDELYSAVKTLAVVFPNTYAWGTSSEDIILVGLKSDRQLDVGAIKEKIEASGETDVKGWKLLAGPVDLAEIIADSSIPISIDNLPHIEFAAARNRITGTRKSSF